MFLLLTVARLSVDLSLGQPPSPMKSPPKAADVRGANVRPRFYALIDQDGKRFLSTSLRGKIIVLDFVADLHGRLPSVHGEFPRLSTSSS
jgi:cytochrome oxidase Cu insertion factor (SCO1/SenC/PrrC family)